VSHRFRFGYTQLGFTEMVDSSAFPTRYISPPISGPMDTSAEEDEDEEEVVLFSKD
jgi:hypothetical protein